MSNGLEVSPMETPEIIPGVLPSANNSEAHSCTLFRESSTEGHVNINGYGIAVRRQSLSKDSQVPDSGCKIVEIFSHYPPAENAPFAFTQGQVTCGRCQSVIIFAAIPCR